jgi:tetratricopeptide (TPR) repeat protein
MRPLAELREAVLQPAERDIALFELGMALDRRGEWAAGIAAVREAAALQPDEPQYLLGLAWLLAHRAAAFEEAVDYARRALALDPTLWKAAGLLGWLLGTVLGRQVEARPFVARAIDLNPGMRPLYATLCRTCLDVEGLDRLCARVEEAAPPHARRDLLYEGLAAALMQVGRYDESLRLLRQAVRAAPDHVWLLTTLAEAETVLGEGEWAARHLERALQLAPSSPDVQSSYLSAAWRSGDRDRITAAIAAAGIATPGPSRLTGSDTQPRGLPSDGGAMAGQTVLLTEMPGGYGEAIQCARMAAILQARGARAILECRQPLRALFETAHGVSGVAVPHDAYPPYDHTWYSFWLPPSLGWTWDELDRVPYFDVPRAVRHTWADRVHAASGGVHVGLDWRPGDELTYRDDPYRRRTISLRQLEPLITMPGTTWHTLSAGEAASRELAGIEAAVPLRDVSPPPADFLETAAVISALDIIVTVDTAVAHLAGALAKPTFLMLPYFADWRWGRHETILGYPTVRPFRQPVPGDSAPVIADVRDALRAFVREPAGRRMHAGSTPDPSRRAPRVVDASADDDSSDRGRDDRAGARSRG